MSEITQFCHGCNGSGARIIHDEQGSPSTQDPCEYCGGDGKELTYTLDDTKLNDIMDKCNDLINKCDDIWEKLNE